MKDLLRGLILAIALFTTYGQAQLPLSHSALNRPLVSLTFDDGWSSVYQEVFPLLDWYNYPATFYIFTSVLGDPDRLTEDQLRTLHLAGHEIGAHSLNHADLTTLIPSLLEEQLATPQKILQKIIDAPVVSFAAPFGRTSPTVIEYVRKHYQSNRSVEAGYNFKAHFDRYHLKVQAIFNNTKVEDVEKWLEIAKRNHLWLIIEYHQVDNHKAAYGVTPDDFEKHLQAIKRRQLPVVTVKDGVKEVMEQLSQ